jgi:hypothetical protein
MDCSYIEEESIHIKVPYPSVQRLNFNVVSDSLDEGEHQISRPFESNILDQSECHHQFIPQWHIMPSRNHLAHTSGPKTYIALIPIKMHILDESGYMEDDYNDNLCLHGVFDAYGKTGLYIASVLKLEPPLERKIIDEYTSNPSDTVSLLQGCQEFIKKEPTMLGKIIIDFCLEYYQYTKKIDKLLEWITIGKEFYSLMQNPIETNFNYKGALHFATNNEYFEYFNHIQRFYQ